MIYMPLKYFPKQTVVLETDIGSDVDDVGALALLLDGARKYGYRIGGISLNRKAPGIVEAVRAMLCTRGFGDVAIASPVSAPDFKSSYLSSMAAYLPDGANLDTIPAVDFYRSLFRDAPDASVTIVSIGFLQNLDAAWRAMPELFERKVRAAVIMGGGFLNDPERPEYNFNGEGHVRETEDFVNNYRGQVIYAGWETGAHVWTDVTPGKDRRDPVIDAYRAFGSQPGYIPYRRQSWDPVTVDFAVNGEGANYRISPSVRVWMENGLTRFRETPDGTAAFVILNRTEEELSGYISRAVLATVE